MTFMPASAIVELPLDELALVILGELEQPGQWNVHSWVIEQGIRSRDPVHDGVSEAVQWLYGKGLISRDWTQTSTEAFITTRLGRRALEVGLREVDATDQFSVDLHPVLEREVRSLYLTSRWDLAASLR
jgi:hypothetical protein